MDQGKILYFMEFFLHYIHFAESFMGSIMKKQNSHNFNFGNFSSSPVKL